MSVKVSHRSEPNVYLKSIEIHARAFLTLIIISIGTVSNYLQQTHETANLKDVTLIPCKTRYTMLTEIYLHRYCCSLQITY